MLYHILFFYLKVSNNAEISIFCFETDILPERTNCIIPYGLNFAYNSSISDRLPDFEITKKSLETVTIVAWLSLMIF